MKLLYPQIMLLCVLLAVLGTSAQRRGQQETGMNWRMKSRIMGELSNLMTEMEAEAPGGKKSDETKMKIDFLSGVMAGLKGETPQKPARYTRDVQDVAVREKRIVPAAIIAFGSVLGGIFAKWG